MQDVTTYLPYLIVETATYFGIHEYFATFSLG